MEKEFAAFQKQQDEELAKHRLEVAKAAEASKKAFDEAEATRRNAAAADALRKQQLQDEAAREKMKREHEEQERILREREARIREQEAILAAAESERQKKLAEAAEEAAIQEARAKVLARRNGTEDHTKPSPSKVPAVQSKPSVISKFNLNDVSAFDALIVFIS
jgi:hypothetical protein